MEFVEFRNLRAACADDACFEMMLTWQNRDVLKKANGYKTSGRNNTHPVLHFNLAWAEDQTPSYDEMIAAADQALAVLGLSEHQAMFVSHTDEDHPHLHVMVSTVHPYSGKTANLAFSWKKFSRFAQQLETSDGKIYCQQRVENNAARDHAAAERSANPDQSYISVKDRSPSRKQWFEQKRLAGRLRNLDLSLPFDDAMKLADGSLKQSRAAFRKHWADIYRAQRDEALRVGLIRPKAVNGFSPNADVVLATLTEHHSTFTRADVAKYLNLATPSADDFAKAMARVEAHPHLVSLGKGPDGRERLTTTDMLRVEERMIGHARALTSRDRLALNPIDVHRLVQSTHLSNEQANACVHITAGHDLSCVVGYAGTGKSTMLGVARDLWARAGYQVQGAAFTGIAARSLEGGSGISSRTIHSLENAWEKNPALLNNRTVIVIDEAGMVGSRQLERVLSKIQAANAKAVLVGDPEQLQAIQAGAPFRAIDELVGSAAITDVRRQHAPWQCAATQALATNKTGDAITRYESAGMVHAHQTRSQATTALLKEWNETRLASPEQSQFVFTHRRHLVRSINKEARELMRESGDLDRADHVINVESGHLRVGIGERLRFTRNDYNLGVMNGSLGTLRSIERNTLTVQLDGEEKRPLKVDLSAYDHFDYGYASTVHKGQSVTVDHAHVLATPLLDRHATYVALSRQRETVHLHWAEEDFYSRDNMVAKLSRERRKDTTLDYERPQAPDHHSIASEADRAAYIFENRERLAAGGASLDDPLMVQMAQSAEALRKQITAMHAHERAQLAEAQMDHATKLARDALYQRPPAPTNYMDEYNQNMPHSAQGEWTPEPHKAETYGNDDREAGEKVVRDFESAAAPDQRRPARQQYRPAQPATQARTYAPSPFGNDHFGNTAHGQKQQELAQQIAEEHRQRQFNEDQKDQRIVQLKREFTRQNSRTNTRDRGKFDRDNER